MSIYIWAYIVLSDVIICALIIILYRTDRIAESVKESAEAQNQYIADVVHELKTPTTIIRSNAELIMDSPEQTVSENMKWLEYIAKEAKRMTKMTEDLLLLSRAGAKREIVKENINLSDLVIEIYDSFSLLFAANDLLANGADIAQGIYIYANEINIKQLVTILLDNAVKYTKAGFVYIKLEKDENYAYIKVTDTGVGIPDEIKAKIFDRFFRSDKLGSNGTAGYGLGLSIAKAIADEHGGEITVDSRLGSGSEFCVKLPAVEILEI